MGVYKKRGWSCMGVGEGSAVELLVLITVLLSVARSVRCKST